MIDDRDLTLNIGSASDTRCVDEEQQRPSDFRNARHQIYKISLGDSFC
jgi:hypothetical protein